MILIFYKTKRILKYYCLTNNFYLHYNYCHFILYFNVNNIEHNPLLL